MKAVVVREHGDSSVLTFVTDHEKPVVKSGQVLIQNRYAGLNFIDTYYRTGLYKPSSLPFVCGQEGGGIIVEMADDVNVDGGSLKIGTEVVYMSFGSYAEYTAVDASRVVPLSSQTTTENADDSGQKEKEDRLTMEVAIACMVQGLTAHYLTSDAMGGIVSKGDWILLYSVGSGTCQWAAQMAKLRGYKVIGTTSEIKADLQKSKSDGEDAKKFGCDELIVLPTVMSDSSHYGDYNGSVDIPKRVMEITGGKGVRCVLDGVGKSTADISLKCLSRRGIWISFGNASGAVPPLSLLSLTVAQSAFVTRPKLGDYVSTSEELHARCTDVFDWIRKGHIDVTIDEIFDLNDARKGHDYVESGQSKGKILFRV